MHTPILSRFRRVLSNFCTFVTEAPAARLTFRRNICGHCCITPIASLTREQKTCHHCGSTVRQRALIHVLSLELFAAGTAISDFPNRPDIVGIDMSGAANYADKLARKLSFTNTFFHKQPRLDITAPDPQWFDHCDFIISSDVFEHVAPPVGRAFENTLRILKPGGLFVFTVPFTKTGDTVEHFPELHDWHIDRRDGQRLLQNVTVDGRSQRFDNLIFHGGEGETLKMRVFSETSVLAELKRAGFEAIRIHGEPCLEFGIVWHQDWSLPISARRPKTSTA